MNENTGEVGFFTEESKEVRGEEAVFPICQWINPEKGQLKFIGTAFFIGQNIFLTAKHNVYDSHNGLTDGLFTICFNGDNTYQIRNIERLIIKKEGDIALGLLRPIIHNITKENIYNKCLVLDINECSLNEPVATFAFPLSEVRTIGERQEAHFNPSFEKGFITEFLPNGRDKTFLPNPCYRTSINIRGGASGGPVFNKEGQVIGINSTGFEFQADEEPVSFVSRIYEALSFVLKDIEIEGYKKGNVTLYDLAVLGHIFLKRNS
ncbi:serine protease [Priestia megaterium]|uniref:S1 family peptidase n=1 Tax=Priestia megaterium TaxID=1404 RepID=UPI0021F3D800|nr:serine protease [Priestia megaterium]UYP10284.1 serine protease [Priestia megaterium]